MQSVTRIFRAGGSLPYPAGRLPEARRFAAPSPSSSSRTAAIRSAPSIAPQPAPGAC